MTNQSGSLLVVEDVPNVLELLEVTLRFKGYPVITARDGLEALEKVAQERPALIITDILMPKMDGYALVHNLRKDPLTRQIPVIFVSATYITPEDKNFALSMGSVRFVEKPIDAEDFLLTVAEILTQGMDTTPARHVRPDLLHRLPPAPGEQAAPQEYPDHAHRAPAFHAFTGAKTGL